MAKKYSLNTKIGQKVFKIEVNFRSAISRYHSSGIDKHGIYICELKIVHQTDRKIALSDKWITTLDRQKYKERKDRFWHYLEDISISIKTKETYFPNGIFATCYTLKDPLKVIEKIKKEIVKKVNSEYGFLFDGIGEKLENLEIIQ